MLCIRTNLTIRLSRINATNFHYFQYLQNISLPFFVCATPVTVFHISSITIPVIVRAEKRLGNSERYSPQLLDLHDIQTFWTAERLLPSFKRTASDPFAKGCHFKSYETKTRPAEGLSLCESIRGIQPVRLDCESWIYSSLALWINLYYRHGSYVL